MFGRKEQKLSARVDTLIAEAARIQGNVEFTGGLHLDGRIQGNVTSQSGAKATLWISEKGHVEGNLEVANVVLNGTVRGDVVAREKLVLGAKARIIGNVSYGAMEMAPGAEVSGKLTPINQGTQVSGEVTAAGATAAVPLKALPGGFDARRSAS